ncbi:hypothetical protein K435DRAFT_960677 [Dendrothele bispora CBS 962.96]|uniref:BTB domain-containing protein n=1 Tax=Dendrothele bispora (strain CBS 962.96) TaxID=1314807 RepID=A0A4S8MT68_DENBC|nr:hypothetical protein K435DRAFT_960677 [Dendrothele bispora CBS 962.96]
MIWVVLSERHPSETSIMTVSTKVDPPKYELPKRHEEYYFEDGNVVIQVECTLFKVWDGPLRRHSKFFDSTNVQEEKPGELQAGADDEHPILVLDVKSEDFERLLWIVYPLVLGQCRAKTVQDWMAILDLCTKWGINDVKSMASRELSSMDLDPIEKIEFQQKNILSAQWAYEAYITVCSRAGPLTVEEGKRLGIEATVKIFTVREGLEKWGRKKPEDVQKAVCDAFKLEVPKPSKT